jgi:hypothetical protein
MRQKPDPDPGPEFRTGEIDFRLARNAVLSEYRKGRLGPNDVCDAHPDLLRAARNVGNKTGRACPICQRRRALVHVSYVFGPGMPASGHTLGDEGELERISLRGRGLSCYVVEVCPHCGWNHLARTFPVGRSAR